MAQISETAFTSGTKRIVDKLLAYLVLILILGAEVAVVLIHALKTDSIFAIAGKISGFWGATLIMTQLLFSARLQILNKLFGIDRLMVSHKFLGPTGFVFAILHPFLLYRSGSYSFGALKLELWPEFLGAVILTILVILVCTSLFREFLKLDYRYWRKIHQLAFGAVLLMAVHSFVLGGELEFPVPIVAWSLALFGYLVLFLWVKFIKPHMLKNNPYVVTDVLALNHNVVNLKLEPVKKKLFEYLPGQFAFLRLFRKGLKTEEHPFTISSSPDKRDYISFTIKNSGDYTSTIGLTKIGDKAAVEGPLGRFSFMVYPQAEHIVFIAGGIGITPLLSMLRYIAQNDNQKQVTLIWANRTVKDTFLPEEFEDITKVMPNLKIHYIMSQQPDYTGLKGYLNDEILKELLCPVSHGTRVFLCGPPVMMKLVKGSLRKIGFANKQIITENFAI